MPVAIGMMNKWLTIQQKSSTQDATGQPQEGWSNLVSVWGALEPLGIKEVFAARQSEVIASHRITIYYREDVHEVAPLLRILHTRDSKQRIFNVISGTESNDAKARQLELLCGEVQPWANQVKESIP